MKKVLILVFRRDPSHLPAQQVQAIRDCFPGKEVEFVRTDPTNYMDHAEECERLKPAGVILPLDRPTPSLAMERGIPHLVFAGPTDTVMKLKPLKPEFEPFEAQD